MKTITRTLQSRQRAVPGGRIRPARALTLALAIALGVAPAACVDQQADMNLYRDQLDGGTAAPTTTRPANRPVEADETLALAAALALANRDNERLALRGEDYLQALLDKDRAFAEFLPTITLAPVYYLNEPYTAPPGLPSGLFPTHALDLPFAGQVTLFNGLRNVAQMKGTTLTAQQQRLLLLDAQSAILLETAQAYYAVLKAERAVQVLDNSVAVQEARVKDVSDKLAQGVARRLDLEQTRAQAAGTRVRLIDAQRGVTKGRAVLATLIGVPYVHGTLSDDYPTPAAAQPLDALLRQAQEQRQDLLAADQAALAARQGVAAAVAQYYPSVSLNLDAFAYRETFPTDSVASAMLIARLPIFTAGRIHAEVRTAWSRFRQAVLARSLLSRQVAQQVRAAHADFAASLRRTADLEIQAGASREALRIAGESYDQGLATNLDRLDAQDRLLSAELQLAAEHFDATVAYLGLLRSTGRLDGRPDNDRAAATQPAATQPRP